MKKSLLAVAVAAALPTFAQAQSSVTLYGVMEVAVQYSDAQSNATIAANTVSEGEGGLRLVSGQSSGSRFGIRGTEDLGGGLQAVFTIENGLNVDTGASRRERVLNRQAFAWPAGGWGQLTFGRQYSPLFWSLILAGLRGLHPLQPLGGLGRHQPGHPGQRRRPGPVLDQQLDRLQVADLRRPDGHAMYAPGENLVNLGHPGHRLDAVGTGNLFGVAAGWQAGRPVPDGAGYHGIDNKSTAATAAGSVLKDVMGVAASYKWSSFGVSVGYTMLNYETLNSADPSISNLLVSVFANIGPGKLFVNATQREYARTSSASATTRACSSASPTRCRCRSAPTGTWCTA
ncbi:MAG: porin [Steroidobacteraceae bacterium]